MPEQLPTDVRDCTAATKLVYVVLKHNEPATAQEIVDATELTIRTVRNSLTELENRGVVGHTLRYDDLRQKRYRTLNVKLPEK
ncbi:helix-turn-helix domain-containing protein [Natronorubrum halophilum]|uniref:HTH domain-containing protein n=1 Tax=Natronorubrum halophilum TaxID=1702106 RepID=UPI0010C1C60A|nr:HTH domain-containing protein [Natronorubrum halophilum]